MRLYLIGLPGVGKSSVGIALAKKLNFEFVDLDTYIEQQAMMFVDEIFHLYGEDYFRALETNCLAELSSKDDIVISCGGGIIKNPDNKKIMDGICIYLKSDLNLIKERLKTSSIERPLLATKTLEDLYHERKALYEAFADVEIENKSIEDTLEKIIEGTGF